MKLRTTMCRVAAESALYSKLGFVYENNEHNNSRTNLYSRINRKTWKIGFVTVNPEQNGIKLVS